MGEKISFFEAVRLNLRGLKLLRKILPGFLWLNSLLSAAEKIGPVVTLYFSSKTLAELAGSRHVGVIVFYAAAAVGTTFLFHIINVAGWHINTKRGNFLYWQRYNHFEGNVYAEMEYANAEDATLNELLADIGAKMKGNHMGLMRLREVTGFIGHLTGLIAAGALLAGMFTANPDGSFINSPWVLAVLLLATVLVPSLVHAALNTRLNRLLNAVFAERAKDNTAMKYYSDNFIHDPRAGKDIRIFNLKGTIMNTLENTLSWYKGRWKRVESGSFAITAALGMLFSMLAYLVIGLRALSGLYDIGEITRYVGAIAAFSAGTTGIINYFNFLIFINAPYLPKLFDFIDIPAAKHQGTRAVAYQPGHSYVWVFDNVSFKYRGAADYALKNINLTLEDDKRLAVVGRNGSGKTTMIKLLCRLYEPTEGVITLNGVDIKEYDFENYIRLLSVVFQDFALLHLSLGENVAASQVYNAEAATRALGLAGFGPRLAEFENGLGTPLYKGSDNEGVIISGGEAQKIALARALYRDAPLIILDEPTSALDPLAEYEIYTKFDRIAGKRAVYISHRLSSCQFCDEIYVFKDGEIVQRGSHAALVAEERGEYYDLWKAQAQYYQQT
jgi:ATP-binding cassette subfamily B protein